ncbi:nitroreductase family protein [Peptostreptococcus equinus]|uniref:Nitroreductase family protein n=1 Tax=Peptostreptococcus equinus TaxID=3003601 RepID=A0ABY7JR36_9FIRM|nr:nitroreductase family protein [Peptostreptococcus sp. CBA3647]WAW14430.1 nitroreductase family protein [Peptostreptococcus sp. CBA3647]
MEVKDCIKSRRSYRKFLDKKVDFEVIEELIELGTYAPTAQYKQPWSFLVIQDKEELRIISEIAKEDIVNRIDELPHFKSYEKWFSDPEYNLFYEAENVIVVYGQSDFYWFKEDCCAASQNIITAALDKGIGTTWVGFAEYVFDMPVIKEKYNIPENCKTVAPIILGYIDEKLKDPKRKKATIYR